MLRRLYVHNFRCFQNFEFKPDGQTSLLLLGKNGSGKSTVRHVLALFQAIGRGRMYIAELVDSGDIVPGMRDVPMRFELEAIVQGRLFQYALALQLEEQSDQLQILEERLIDDGVVAFERHGAEVKVHTGWQANGNGTFNMNPGVLALTVIQGAPNGAEQMSFGDWLAAMILLAPVPQDIRGEASGSETAIDDRASNLPDWLAGLLKDSPAAYTTVISHLQLVMPDLTSFRFLRLGRNTSVLLMQFSQDGGSFELPLSALSDGEKCFVLSAVLVAANAAQGPLFAFWDEPDNYLAFSEVNQFVLALKRSFLRTGGQLVTTSHHPQAVLCFSEDSTWVMGRRSHAEPAIVRPLEELKSPDADSSVTQRLLDGDLEPWH